MDLEQFYGLLLPEGGNFALFSTPRKRHAWVRSHAELAALTRKLIVEANWYFATASFSARERTQECVAGKRCLYLDIDAGPEKFNRRPEAAYATAEDAVRAVFGFAAATRLIPSAVVFSGAGIHCYFALSETIDAAAWRPLAVALGVAARRHGLKADPACTTDSARVLRPLGALHANGQRVRLLKHTPAVYSVDALRALLPEAQAPLSAPARARRDVNAELPAFEAAPASAVKAAQRCGALRAIAERAGDVPEPEWRAMIGVVKFSTEGADLAHEWSRGHPDYDDAQTQDKFDRYAGTGPTLCATFEAFSDACAACEHRGKIASPLALGRLTVQQIEALPPEQRPAPAPAPAPAPPADVPFARAEFGEHFRAVRRGERWMLEADKIVEKETSEGTERIRVWFPFSSEVFWIEGWVAAGRRDAEHATVKLRLYTNAAGTVTDFDMPARPFGSRQETVSWLAEKGVTIPNNHVDTANAIHNYTLSQFTRARTMPSRFSVRKHFGVQFESEAPNARLVVAHGRYIIRHDGTIEDAAVSPDLMGARGYYTIADLPPSAAGRWGVEVWKSSIIPGARQQVEFMRRWYSERGWANARLAIMLALASPLMVFAADTVYSPDGALPSAGLTVSLYSRESGQGKTALQRSIASAFGDPAGAVCSGSSQDATINALMSRAATNGTMPFILDEVTGNRQHEVALLVNTVSNGQEKARSSRSGWARDVRKWALIGLVSTNLPQRELLAGAQTSSDALQMRLIELRCEFEGLIQRGSHVRFEADRDELLAKHYGALGAVLHLAIANKGYEAMRRVVQEKFAQAAGLMPESTQRERFWQRGMACVLAAQELLGRMGLAPFEADDLVATYVAATQEALDFAERISRTPTDMMRKMISDLAPGIIVTHAEPINAGRVEQVLNRQQLRAPYVGRRVESGRYVHILTDAMRQWARDNQCSYSELVAAAFKMGYLRHVAGESRGKPRTRRITRSTDLAIVAGECFTFDERELFPEDVAAPNAVDLPAQAGAPDEPGAEPAESYST